jgi:hypothetical protein
LLIVQIRTNNSEIIIKATGCQTCPDGQKRGPHTEDTTSIEILKMFLRYKSQIRRKLAQMTNQTGGICRKKVGNELLSEGVEGQRKKRVGWVGDDLLSQGVSPQVPSAQVGLTAGFEMEPGGPPPLRSPTPPRPASSSRLRLLFLVAYCVNVRQTTNFSVSRWISPRPLVRVSSRHYCLYTARLSSWSSSSGLTWLSSEEAHLEVSFPL